MTRFAADSLLSILAGTTYQAECSPSRFDNRRCIEESPPARTRLKTMLGS